MSLLLAYKYTYSVEKVDTIYYPVAGKGGAVTRTVFLHFSISVKLRGCHRSPLPLTLKAFSSRCYLVSYQGQGAVPTSHGLHLSSSSCSHDSPQTPIYMAHDSFTFSESNNTLQSSFELKKKKKSSTLLSGLTQKYWILQCHQSNIIFTLQVAVIPLKCTFWVYIITCASFPRNSTETSRNFCKIYWGVSCCSMKCFHEGLLFPEHHKWIKNLANTHTQTWHLLGETDRVV